ncbi:homeobox-leucine zipper protein HAT22-like [Cucurbita maxima]|uniref:Homeobox-leucine zipper protein HAT22-like n=1 Tax=Cucurbita maxima TaxID=3661 RepID=A0A6J1KU00_CUCMA|nr:homeobox-leucine zipper protein HAT22-like [Cucurbita maxima]
MGFDDLPNTGLLLGLGLTLQSKPACLSQKPNKPVDLFSFPAVESEPSLTLGLSTTADLCRQPSPHSTVSSLSGGKVKRERDVSGEDIEEEKASSRVSDEEEDGSNARKKLRLTKEQSALLEESFKLHCTLNPKQKQALARELNLRPRQVEVWFQNRRARTKLKQTEVDCEFLKRCCETLTDENRRLQKELQELKALKLTKPLFMQMPAATLTMCPSCERIGGATATVNGNGNPKGAFSMAPKPQFYKPFTNPSAAC